MLAFFITAFFFGSCGKRPFVPVNVGREHGNPTTPWVVSHLPEKNHWAFKPNETTQFFSKNSLLRLYMPEDDRQEKSANGDKF